MTASDASESSDSNTNGLRTEKRLLSKVWSQNVPKVIQESDGRPEVPRKICILMRFASKL